MVVEIWFLEGSKSRTESMMMADLVAGSAMMYCHVEVAGSKIGWMIGSWAIVCDVYGGIRWEMNVCVGCLCFDVVRDD